MKRSVNLHPVSAFRRGASVLIALLVFLLAALSGTVALVMATSNAGRYTYAKEDQQAYLAVASAAKLICKKLETTQIELVSIPMNVEPGHAFPQNSDDIDAVNYYVNDTSVPAKKDLFFSDERFTNNVKLLGPYQSTLDNPETLSYQPISFALTPSTGDMGTVQVELNMATTDFVFRLWLEQGEHSVYPMTIHVPAEWDPGQWTTPDENTGYQCYTRLKWKVKNVEYTFEGTGLTA